MTYTTGLVGRDAAIPEAEVTADASGNLYGTANVGGANAGGIVWEITAAGTYLDLHDFGGSDGGNPVSNVSFDSSGNLYGTASTGGSQGVGVAWEITAP